MPIKGYVVDAPYVVQTMINQYMLYCHICQFYVLIINNICIFQAMVTKVLLFLFVMLIK